MTSLINRNQGIIGAIGLVLAIIFFFLPDHKIWAAIIMGATIVAIASIFIYEKWQPKSFDDIRKISKILFIDDKDCQIVTNLQRSNFDVRKIDNVLSPGTDKDVQWSNIIFVDYKDIGKKLFGKKEGLGLIKELRRMYGKKKRYIIYSSVQDFDGLVDFPYIRKNASYDEFISLIFTEAEKL